MNELGDAWSLGNADINTINNIMQNGTSLNCHFTLSDGFKMEFIGSVLKIDGTHYLYLDLLGNGGGFPGDVISHVIQLDDVLDDNRLEELFELAMPDQSIENL